MLAPFKDKFPNVHPTAFIADSATVIGDVEIGEDSSVWFGSVVRGDVNFIRIGARTNIQDLTVVHVTTDTHPTAFIADSATVIGDVEIGEDSSVWFGSVVRGDVNFIRIGARTNIQDLTVVHVTTDTHPTVLEDEITVGHRVVLHGCHVESGCLIGIGAVLLDGVRVGCNSLVAARSLLTPGTQVPPNSLVMGSPAKVERELTPDELAYLDTSWRNYVELKKEYLAADKRR